MRERFQYCEFYRLVYRPPTAQFRPKFVSGGAVCGHEHYITVLENHWVLNSPLAAQYFKVLDDCHRDTLTERPDNNYASLPSIQHN